MLKVLLSNPLFVANVLLDLRTCNVSEKVEEALCGV